VKRFFFALVVLALPALGRAQVVVNHAALDQLAGVTAPVVVPVVAHKVVRQKARRRRAVKRVVVLSAPAVVVGKPFVVKLPAVAKPGQGAPFVPAAPKTPAVKMAVARPAPVLPALPGAVVLRFGDGAAALPAGAAAELGPVCKAAAAGDTVAIDGYAPADAADPSAAMRLSMDRAFAVRDALTACGVPGARIFPRADGAAGDVATARITLARGAPN